MTFDPDAAALPGSGIFGLNWSPEEAKVVILPVPFEATTSYGGGTSSGPAAVLEASHQVDLYDRDTGRPYEQGISMLGIDPEVLEWSREAEKLAAPLIETAGQIAPGSEEATGLARVNEIGSLLNEKVYRETVNWLERDKLVAVLGGDHSVPYGAMKACAEAFEGLGVLHLDAHADLRDAYEGFEWSHASIFHNVATRLDRIEKIVQVGLRDVGQSEASMIEDSKGRIVGWYDSDMSDQKQQGRGWTSIADEIVEDLPQNVYLSWDIDGLDPTLCPGTGTPVPGGLSWHEAIGLLKAVVRSGRRIVGLDLCEVSPGEGEWDANVGARLLYKMIGFALISQEAAKRE